MDVLILLFKLIIGHALGDFVLQPSPMSNGKNRHVNLRQQYGEGFPQWYYWLSAHALTHSGIVLVITGSVTLALAEAISHWLIDYARCEKWISLHEDQVLHLLFKALYCAIFLFAQPI